MKKNFFRLFTRKKEQRQEDLRQEFIAACQKADVEKLIAFLEQGFDPNQYVRVWVGEFWSNPPEYCDISHYESRTLLDICRSEAIKRLLRAYGGKTTKELKEEDEARRKKEAAVIEAERQRQQEAKYQAELEAEEARRKKVDAFLSSK